MHHFFLSKWVLEVRLNVPETRKGLGNQASAEAKLAAVITIFETHLASMRETENTDGMSCNRHFEVEWIDTVEQAQMDKWIEMFTDD